MPVDELVDGALDRRVRPARTAAPCRPGGRSTAPPRRPRSPSSSRASGIAGAPCASGSSGLVVRMAMPPWLRLSVRAAAMVLPKRYAMGIPSTTRGLLRRLKSSGNRCGASDGRMCCTALYSLMYPATPSSRQLAHFVGARDGPAENEDGQPPLSSVRISRTTSGPTSRGSRRSTSSRSRLEHRRGRAPAVRPRF